MNFDEWLTTGQLDKDTQYCDRHECEYYDRCGYCFEDEVDRRIDTLLLRKRGL